MQVNFHSALYQLNLLYQIELDEDTFEELGLIAWNFIGNKNCRLYKISVTMDDSLMVELPCNADIVEAVTNNEEDWNRVTDKHKNGDLHSMNVEYDLESQKTYKDPLYIRGKYIDYNQVGNILYFNKNYGNINILYKGIVVDEDGLPLINDRESLAIAAYCAYVTKYKEAISTNNGNILQLASVLKQEWLIKCDQARIPESLSQNDMDNILEAKVRGDRKTFKKAYKPII